MKKIFGSTLALFMLFVLSIAGTAGRGPGPSGPAFIIDSHIHYRASEAWETRFLDVYARYNAMACILINKAHWDRGIAFAKRHPDRVIPYAAVDQDSPTVIQDIQTAYDMGFKGLGELFARGDFNYDDPRNNGVWALAEQLGLPVLPHTGIHASGVFARMRPAYLATVCSRFPNLIVHAAHFGNPWYEEAGEAARKNPNLYFDITGTSLIKKDHDPGFWLQYLWWTPHIGKPHVGEGVAPAFEKIVFGTDESPDGLEANIHRFNKMLDACNVAEETRARCYYGTMAEIHGIDVTRYLPKRR